MSPEALSQTYSEKSDVWSYGAVLVEILSNQIPFGEKLDLADIVVGVRDRKWTPLSILDDQKKALCDIAWLDEAPRYLVSLMKKCFKADPGSRPSFDDVVSFLEDNVPDRVAEIEVRRQKRRDKRAKLLKALDEVVVS
jgi:serine/threonine protein kinase